MIVERLNRAVVLPFDLTELKAHVRILHSDEDALLTRYGQAAATEIEAYAQVALLHQTIRLTCGPYDGAGFIDLPIIPVLDPTVISITCDGVPFTSFRLLYGQRPAVLVDDGLESALVTIIEYRAGFGAAHSAIPDDLQAAIMDQATAFYDARGALDGKTNGLSPHTARIAARYRRVRV